MIDIKLPFWLDGAELTKLKQAAKTYWDKVETWLSWPLTQLDAETCTLGMLDLLAWQRDIERMKEEPESLYRLRVKYALVNAQDAGSVAGIKRIFSRLGVGTVEVEERDPLKDWDVITLHLSDDQLAQNPDLLDRILDLKFRSSKSPRLVI